MSVEILPWHQDRWAQVSAQVQDNSLPHALLISAPRGTGADRFASALAALLLCADADGRVAACGACQECHLYAQGTHPDCLHLQPEEPGKPITVDAARQLGGFAAHSGMRSQRSVVLLNPAEALNRNAANALLKTLEEPRPGVHVLLATHAPGRLLPTIQSRCQRLVLPAPSVSVAQAFLQDSLPAGEDIERLLREAHGAPLLALRLHAQELVGPLQALGEALQRLERGEGDVLRVVGAAADLPLEEVLDRLYHQLRERARRAGPAACSRSLFRALDQLVEARRAMFSAAHPNRELLLESLLLDWPAAS